MKPEIVPPVENCDGSFLDFNFDPDQLAIVPPVENCDGSFLDLNFDPDQLAMEINEIDFPTPKPPIEPDSAVIALRNMFSVDQDENAAREPGNRDLLKRGEIQPNDMILNLREGLPPLLAFDIEELE